LKTSVFSVNAKEKKVVTTKGDHIHYDKLLIATGCEVKVPEVKGVDLKGVFKLRSNLDQLKIKEAVATAKKVVIVGGSFVGSEAAASLKGKFGDAVSIEIVNSDSALFKKSFGEEIGKMM
jgi:NAD(P)H-nitrite reductase large subunit